MNPTNKTIEELLSAVRMLLEDGSGCPMCDSGKLRNLDKEHWDDCNWNNARNIYLKVLEQFQQQPQPKVFKLIEQRHEIEKIFICYKCECGHTAPIEFVTHNEDGNVICPNCVIEELNSRFVIEELNSRFKPTGEITAQNFLEIIVNEPGDDPMATYTRVSKKCFALAQQMYLKLQTEKNLEIEKLTEELCKEIRKRR